MDDIDRFLREDLGTKGDITSDALLQHERAHAGVIVKEPCIVAGLSEATSVFRKTGSRVHGVVKDGDSLKAGSTVLKIQGPARSILKAERLALNIIGRMSGIATETHQLVTRCRAINPTVAIAATRKTTPGFRAFEKKAVILGGGDPHRYGLYDAILIKDNHLQLVGSVEQALEKMRETSGKKPIEIEVESEADALTAARLNVDVIMLDNLPPHTGRRIAQKVRNINPQTMIEVSGGITSRNILQYASFADRISLGCLTHSSRSIDVSLEMFKN
ncbi:MAG: carboxylating nicotinate-nucleotide diphosphorylase [Candidatus Thermoplasmatota archaeon]|nr:carboxylating nicotinate-nucleotide diphosphorylase [Candidatus Thermoplasmatota archaeon]